MLPDLSPDAWAQIRYDYEHTERPIPDICAEHGISSGTLRDRVRRWGWARRRSPIPAEGPAAMPAPPFGDAAPFLSGPPPVAASLAAAESWEGMSDDSGTAEPSRAAPPAASGDSAPAESDPAVIVPRLRQAVACVLPAIEANLTRLGTQPAHSRDLERTARALGTLTRTLRELNTLLNEHQSRAPGRICDCDGDMPEDIDEFRNELVRRMDAIIASRTGETVDDAAPQET